jgi:sugar fermentation stimulation protein
MRYYNTARGVFISRPNRFIAHVDIAGQDTVCHVKNTGRCRELLVPGAEVVLEKSSNPARKTQYDLVAVYKNGTLINMDSQAPNALAAEYLPVLFPDAAEIRPECVYGDSRLDFRVDTPERRIYVEVKGVTLEKDGLALFPMPRPCGARSICGSWSGPRVRASARIYFSSYRCPDAGRFRPTTTPTRTSAPPCAGPPKTAWAC